MVNSSFEFELDFVRAPKNLFDEVDGRGARARPKTPKFPKITKFRRIPKQIPFPHAFSALEGANVWDTLFEQDLKGIKRFNLSKCSYFRLIFKEITEFKFFDAKDNYDLKLISTKTSMSCYKKYKKSQVS